LAMALKVCFFSDLGMVHVVYSREKYVKLYIV
jgi:hypothetical protein